MTQERAKQVYDAHLNSGHCPCRKPIESFLTDDEKTAVREKWKSMAGWTCWNDAFMTFLPPRELPPYQRPIQTAIKAGATEHPTDD